MWIWFRCLSAAAAIAAATIIYYLLFIILAQWRSGRWSKLKSMTFGNKWFWRLSPKIKLQIHISKATYMEDPTEAENKIQPVGMWICK